MTASREKVTKPISQIQTHVVANRAALVAVEAASGPSAECFSPHPPSKVHLTSLGAILTATL